MDVVEKRLPATLGPLMTRSGYLIWVKLVLTAIPIYTMMADGLPP